MDAEFLLSFNIDNAIDSATKIADMNHKAETQREIMDIEDIEFERENEAFRFGENQFSENRFRWSRTPTRTPSSSRTPRSRSSPPLGMDSYYPSPDRSERGVVQVAPSPTVALYMEKHNLTYKQAMKAMKADNKGKHLENLKIQGQWLREAGLKDQDDSDDDDEQEC